MTTSKPNAGKRPSLHDVAQMAGVSAAAVSYVVNGRTSEVGAETLERIQKAISVLRYQPQRRGLSLKLNREFAIGLVIVDPNPSFLADPFTTQVATGLSNALVEPGFGLTVTGCRSVEDLEKLLRRPIGVDAFAVMTSGPGEIRQQIYKLLHNTNLPTLIIQEDAPNALQDTCAILQDDYAGAQQLANHLLSNGARTILWVGPSRNWPAIERRKRGIAGALEGKAELLRLQCDEQDFDATVAAVDAQIESAGIPDAIMGANDQIAIAALKVLHRRGIAVPDRIQVTGFNDFAFRNYASPLLTTVTSSANEIGRRGAEAILSRLDKGAFPERRTELPVRLNLGETTLPPNTPPPHAAENP